MELVRETKTKHDKMDFIILTTQRSGSHFVSSSLDSHPDISCDGELYYNEMTGGKGKIRGGIVHYNHYEKLDVEFDKIIHLIRNPFDVATSRLATIQPRVYHNQGEQEYQEVEVNTQQTIEMSRKIMRTQAYWLDKTNKSNQLVVCYEDLQEKGFDSVLRFLGVNEKPLKSQALKQNIKYVFRQ